MVPAWLTASQGSRVPGLNFSLTKLFPAIFTLPLSSVLCSWGSLCSGSAPTMVFSGALVMAQDSLLCLSSPLSSAQGSWQPLESSALLAREDADAGTSYLRVCCLSHPSAHNALSAATCMVASTCRSGGMTQTSPPPRDLPDCPF